MIKLQNPLGIIEISEEYIAKLISNTAACCYGVLEIPNIKPSQELNCDIFKDGYKGKCVKVTANDDKLIIDLHIIVIYGINIAATVKSVINKIRFVLKECTGMNVGMVKVYVDGMRSE